MWWPCECEKKLDQGGGQSVVCVCVGGCTWWLFLWPFRCSRLVGHFPCIRLFLGDKYAKMCRQAIPKCEEWWPFGEKQQRTRQLWYNPAVVEFEEEILRYCTEMLTHWRNNFRKIAATSMKERMTTGHRVWMGKTSAGQKRKVIFDGSAQQSEWAPLGRSKGLLPHRLCTVTMWWRYAESSHSLRRSQTTCHHFSSCSTRDATQATFSCKLLARLNPMQHIEVISIEAILCKENGAVGKMWGIFMNPRMCSNFDRSGKFEMALASPTTQEISP